MSIAAARLDASMKSRRVIRFIWSGPLPLNVLPLNH